MALSLLRLRLDPLSFALPDNLSLSAPQKIANHCIRAFSRAVNIADSFVTNGALHGRNITIRPDVRDVLSRVTPRFAPYLASFASAQNLQMIGGALTIMFLTSVLSDEKNVHYAAERLETMSEYVTAEASAAWEAAGNDPRPETALSRLPHYL